MFLKDSAMESSIFFWNEEGVWGVLWKNILLAELLGSQHLFEILRTSFTVKNSENVVKSGCFKKLLRWRTPILFQNEERI